MPARPAGTKWAFQPRTARFDPAESGSLPLAVITSCHGHAWISPAKRWFAAGPVARLKVAYLILEDAVRQSAWRIAGDENEPTVDAHPVRAVVGGDWRPDGRTRPAARRLALAGQTDLLQPTVCLLALRRETPWPGGRFLDENQPPRRPVAAPILSVAALRIVADGDRGPVSPRLSSSRATEMSTAPPPSKLMTAGRAPTRSVAELALLDTFPPNWPHAVVGCGCCATRACPLSGKASLPRYSAMTGCPRSAADKAGSLMN